MLFASDGKVYWLPYPANDFGMMEGKTITLEFSAATVTIEGTNLLPLALALADYRAAVIRVAGASAACKTEVKRIVVEVRE